MKKILFFALVIMGSVFAQAQSAAQIEKMQVKELDALEKRVTYTNKNIAFNKNQIAKLERVFFNKSKEILELRAKEVEKAQYIQEFRKIEKKYDPKVEAILTTPQRVEYRRNSKKNIRKKKD